MGDTRMGWKRQTLQLDTAAPQGSVRAGFGAALFVAAIALLGCRSAAEPPPPAPADAEQEAAPQEPVPAVEAPAPELSAPSLQPPPDAHPLDAEDALWLYDSGGDTTTELLSRELDVDTELQADMLAVVNSIPEFRRALASDRLGLFLVDLNDPLNLRVATVRPDWETFTASLSKIAVLLATVQKARDDDDPDLLVRRKEELDLMIKRSKNPATMAIFGEVGFEAMRDSVYRYHLYDDELGGLWWTPNHNNRTAKTRGSITATPRMATRYFLMMEQGRLLDAEGSRTIKAILKQRALAVFSRGIQAAYPEVVYYGKCGILDTAISEVMLIEAPDTRYIFTILSRGLPDYKSPILRRFGRDLHAMMKLRGAAAAEAKDTVTPAAEPESAADPVPAAAPDPEPTGDPASVGE